MEWSERASGVDVGGSVTRIEYIPESGGNGEGGGRGGRDGRPGIAREGRRACMYAWIYMGEGRGQGRDERASPNEWSPW